MADTNSMQTIRLSDTDEFRKFYRTLAITQTQISSYLIQASSEEEKKLRAVELTEKLETLRASLRNMEDKCTPPQVFNPHTGDCE